MAHIKLLVVRDAELLAGLPADAHIVGHRLSSEALSLIVESATFPWTPNGLPLDKMPLFEVEKPNDDAAPAPEPVESDSH